MPYLGETLSLVTALIWAFAIILFKKSGETVHPMGLNLFKNSLGLVLIFLTALVMNLTVFYDASLEKYLLLLLSGALGIGFADTLLFYSLNRIGAGYTAIVFCLYLPTVILLSNIWLHESLSPWQYVGVGLVIGAVALATYSGGQEMAFRKLLLGLGSALLAIITMAVAVMLTKPLLKDEPFMWLTMVRMVGGLVVLVVLILLRSDRQKLVGSLNIPEGRLYTWGGSFLGGYLSMLLWLAGMKHTQVSIAATLNQTSNVFIFVLAMVFLKEKLTTAKVLGIGLAFSGVLLVTFG